MKAIVFFLPPDFGISFSLSAGTSIFLGFFIFSIHIFTAASHFPAYFMNCTERLSERQALRRGFAVNSKEITAVVPFFISEVKFLTVFRVKLSIYKDLAIAALEQVMNFLIF